MIRRKKRVSIVFAVLFAATISVFSMFPVENLFINFKSPEKVFNYINTGEINEIIYGQDSCLIVYSKGNNTGGYYIIPKTATGYKIPNYFTIKKISHKFDESGLFDVYNVKGTQDFYVFGTVHLDEKENEIYICNEMGKKIEADIVRVEDTSFIYFFLHDFPNKYYLSINEEKVLIYG